MKKKYRLFYDGQEIESSDLRHLQRLAKGTECYYEIYEYKMFNPNGNAGKTKMNIMDMREAKRMAERGVSKNLIAAKYGISSDHLTRLLRQFVIDSF